jgi:concanavalin A-like lectin/glucanase superfamily protein
MKWFQSSSAASKICRLGLAGFLAAFGAAILPATAFAELTHRYSFKDGNANDSVGKVNGKLEGGAKVSDNKLVLDNTGKSSGDSGLAFLSFSDRILPESGSATVEVWFKSNSDGGYARVFDFGERGQGYLFLTVNDGGDNAIRTAITATDFGDEATVHSEEGVNDDKPHMAAVVIDTSGKKLHLYVDGKEVDTPEPLGDNGLDKIKGASNWLGRSVFEADAGFTGSISEFRVYSSALSADQIASDFKAGGSVVEAAAPK